MGPFLSDFLSCSAAAEGCSCLINPFCVLCIIFFLQAHVFDLNVNKYEALCTQLVMNKMKSKITHIQFNPVYPVVVIGGERGFVVTLKLSPNLRKMPKVRTTCIPIVEVLHHSRSLRALSLSPLLLCNDIGVAALSSKVF